MRKGIEAGIEFYFKPEEPVDFGALKKPIITYDFSKFISQEDGLKIDAEWKKLLTANPKAFSLEKGLFVRWNTEENLFLTTNYHDYSAISRTGNDPCLNRKLYPLMHICSVNGVVKSRDGDILVHRRLQDASCVPDSYDCSVGGFAYNRGILESKNSVIDNDGNPLNFLNNLYFALKRELAITPEEVAQIKVLSVHSSRHPDFSGMCDFLVQSKLPTKELEERATAKVGIAYQDYEILDDRKLPSFIIESFGLGENSCLDGCATLMSSLPWDTFQDVISQLQAKGMRIEFGKLQDGVFKRGINNESFLNI